MIHKFRNIEVMSSEPGPLAPQRALRTLLAIASAGSFAGAAAQRNMTLSAVSMQMKSLEDALGVAVFDRAHRPPKLTPLGRRIVTQAREVVAAERRLAEICSAPGPLNGHFRIGFVLTSSVRLLPHFLARAPERFPNATFEVATGLSDALTERVMAGDLDGAVVTRGDAAPASLTVTVLTTEALVYCVPAHARETPIAECMATLPFIHFMPKAGIGRLIARHLEEARITPRQTIVLDAVEGVAECVRTGVGFAILPEPDVVRYAGTDIHFRPITDAFPDPREGSHARSEGPRTTHRQLVLLTREESPLDAAADILAAALTTT